MSLLQLIKNIGLREKVENSPSIPEKDRNMEVYPGEKKECPKCGSTDRGQVVYYPKNMNEYTPHYQNGYPAGRVIQVRRYNTPAHMQAWCIVCRYSMVFKPMDGENGNV